GHFPPQRLAPFSFAVAHLPLDPPESTGRLFRRNRTTGANPTTKKTATGPTPVTRTRTGPTPVVKTRTGPTPIVKTRTGPNPVTRWTPAGANPVVEPASIELAPPSDATDPASELATTGVV